MMTATTMNHSHHFYSDDEHSMDKKLSKDYLDFNEQIQDLDTMSRYEFQHWNKQEKDDNVEVMSDVQDTLSKLEADMKNMEENVTNMEKTMKDFNTHQMGEDVINSDENFFTTLLPIYEDTIEDEDIINDAHMMEVQELKNKLNNLENECKENVVKYELVINKLTKQNESLVNELMKERMKTRNNVETTHRKPVDAALGSKDIKKCRFTENLLHQISTLKKHCKELKEENQNLQQESHPPSEVPTVFNTEGVERDYQKQIAHLQMIINRKDDDIKDLKWKYKIEEQANRETIDGLTENLKCQMQENNEILKKNEEFAKSSNKLKRKLQVEKEKTLENLESCEAKCRQLKELKEKYKELDSLKERGNNISQANRYLAEQLSRTRKAAQHLKNSKYELQAEKEHLNFQLNALNEYYISTYQRLENFNQENSRKINSLMNQLNNQNMYITGLENDLSNEKQINGKHLEYINKIKEEKDNLLINNNSFNDTALRYERDHLREVNEKNFLAFIKEREKKNELKVELQKIKNHKTDKKEFPILDGKYVITQHDKKGQNHVVIQMEDESENDLSNDQLQKERSSKKQETSPVQALRCTGVNGVSNTHQGTCGSTQDPGLSVLFEPDGEIWSSVKGPPSSCNHAGMGKPLESVRKKVFQKQLSKKQLSRQRQNAAQKAAQEEYYLENYLINQWGS